MRIYHILKKDQCDTDFRPTMLQAIQSVKKYTDNEKIKIYIASGFFNQISATPILTFQDTSLQTDLLSVLTGLSVEIFGAYNGRTDLLALKNALVGYASSVTGYYKYNFHAKIFIITIDGKVVFEIIGSSNMTRRAYEGLGRRGFSSNVECDLILFDENMCMIDIAPNENIMKLSYDEDENNDIALEQRAEDILKYLDSYKSVMTVL